MIHVTVWNENLHEQEEGHIIHKHYPNGIHNYIAGFLSKQPDLTTTTATLQMPEHGLTTEVLDKTDVLIWWAHYGHNRVSDEVAERVHQAVLQGMGLIVLHSGHLCKPMKLCLGTSCTLNWRDDDRERLWCCNPGHPIAKDIPAHIELEQEEMYGEFFDIPKPDDVVFLGWYKGGEVFRSGVTFSRGRGKIFYFQPGHEEYPTYHNAYIQKIITNAVYWAAPTARLHEEIKCGHPEPLE